MESASNDRRRRIERWIDQQPNGKYLLCVMVGARPRFGTTDAETWPTHGSDAPLCRALRDLVSVHSLQGCPFAEMANLAA